MLFVEQRMQILHFAALEREWDGLKRALFELLAQLEKFGIPQANVNRKAVRHLALLLRGNQQLFDLFLKDLELKALLLLGRVEFNLVDEGSNVVISLDYVEFILGLVREDPAHDLADALVDAFVNGLGGAVDLHLLEVDLLDDGVQPDGHARDIVIKVEPLDHLEKGLLLLELRQNALSHIQVLNPLDRSKLGAEVPDEIQHEPLNLLMRWLVFGNEVTRENTPFELVAQDEFLGVLQRRTLLDGADIQRQTKSRQEFEVECKQKVQ